MEIRFETSELTDRFEAFVLTILRLNRAVQKIKELEMNRLGLKGSHATCLFYLGEHPDDGLTIGQLAEACCEDKAAVSRSVAQLVEKGLAKNNAPEGSRGYRSPYRLTPAGQVVASQMYDRIEKVVSVGGAGLTSQQRRSLYESLRLVLSNLDEYYREEPR